MSLAILVGKTLRSISRGHCTEAESDTNDVREDADKITFHCEDGDYVYGAMGDCCSRTYIDSVEGPTSGVIMSVDEPLWSNDENDGSGRYWTKDDGELKFYKATFAIEGNGHLDVTYRNESNGYYGGSLELLSRPTPLASERQGSGT